MATSLPGDRRQVPVARTAGAYRRATVSDRGPARTDDRDAAGARKPTRRLGHAAVAGRPRRSTWSLEPPAGGPRPRRRRLGARPGVRRRAVPALPPRASSCGSASARTSGEVVGVDIELDCGRRRVAARRLGPRRRPSSSATPSAHDSGRPRFDAVVGNPPYLNQLAAATSRGGRSRHGGGPYADAAARVPGAGHRPGAARTAAGSGSCSRSRCSPPATRRHPRGPSLDERRARRLLVGAASRSSTPPCTPSSPRSCAARRRGRSAVATGTGARAARRRRRRRPGQPPTWSHLRGRRRRHPGRRPARPDGRPSAITPRPRPASATSSTGSSAARQPTAPTDGAARDRRAARTRSLPLGRAPGPLRRPALRRARASTSTLARDGPELARWVGGRLVPKVLVATQTAVLEAAADPTGAWVPSVPVISVEPRPGPTSGARRGARLAGRPRPGRRHLPRRRARLHLDQARRQPGARRCRGPRGPLDAAAERLRRGDVDGAARASLDAYGLERPRPGACVGWWLGGGPPARRRVSATRRRAAPGRLGD